MHLTRRRLLATAPALFTAPVEAASDQAPPWADYERQTGGRVGLHARNTVTGATVTWRADERFVMCSSFKASLVACVLRRVDRGLERLETRVAFTAADYAEMYAPIGRANVSRGFLTVEAMCEGAVEMSDNLCANKLLERVGGPPAMTAFWRSIGDTTSRLDDNEPELNRSPPGDPHDTTTPAAMAGVLTAVVLGDVLSPASRQRLSTWMIGCRTGADRLRAGLPRAWRVADKTGNNGKDAAGDIAVLWKPDGAAVVVCAYVQGGSPEPDQIRTVFAAIGRGVGERL